MKKIFLQHTIKQIAEINEVNVGPIVLKYDPSLDEGRCFESGEMHDYFTRYNTVAILLSYPR